MKICEYYEHNGAIKTLESRLPLADIKNIVEAQNIKFGKDNPKHIKEIISERFNKEGWADRVKVVPNANLTISFMKNRVGVCFQLGNVARMYADLLKLEEMGQDRKIDVGVIILPDALKLAKLGANYVRFDRLAKELQIYAKIFKLPILLLSLAN